MSPAATVLSGSSLESEAWAAPHVRAAVELPAGRNKSQPMQAALRPPDAATTSPQLRLRARRYPIPTQPCPPSSCRSCCSAPSYPALAVSSHGCPLRLVAPVISAVCSRFFTSSASLPAPSQSHKPPNQAARGSIRSQAHLPSPVARHPTSPEPAFPQGARSGKLRGQLTDSALLSAFYPTTWIFPRKHFPFSAVKPAPAARHKHVALRRAAYPLACADVVGHAYVHLVAGE